MLLAGSELTKEDKESQLYDEFERFKMLPRENINEYYVRFHKLVNDMRNIRMTMPNIQLNSKFHAAQDRIIIEKITPTTNDPLAFVSNIQPYAQPSQDGRIVVQNVLGRPNQNQNQRNFARGNGATCNGGALNRMGNANAVLDEEELLFLAGKQANTFDADVDNQPVQVLALNEDNIFQANECDAFDSDVDDEPTARSIFMANLSSAGLANLQASPSNASILSEVHILEKAIDHSVTNQDEHEIHNEVQQENVIDSTSVDIGNSNVIPYEQYLSVNNVSVVPSCASSTLNDA
ncbi:hypothetical protein Tco_0839235 [Tanacetum coccineum]|uniref:Integrase, catalytic region, zinc finger, CCHC-type, peptidase aspartic, catalytic n=1 Tax=Tanacetum coccineum TaxID=301880 RepID=A0ABQ5AU68_9ASTR